LINLARPGIFSEDVMIFKRNCSMKIHENFTDFQNFHEIPEKSEKSEKY
jgi:hypothetical protein